MEPGLALAYLLSLKKGKKVPYFNQLLKKSNFLEISNCLKWNRVLTYFFAFVKQFNFYGVARPVETGNDDLPSCFHAVHGLKLFNTLRCKN